MKCSVLDVSVTQFHHSLCLVQAIREVECKAGGSLDTALDSFSLTGDVVLSLGFRSTEADGILLSKTEQVSPTSGHLPPCPSDARV